MNNTATNETTHALVDISENEVLATGDMNDVTLHILEWNASFGTQYADIEQFNKGEEFYKIMTVTA